MDRAYIVENNESRERLIKLVNEITDKELELVIYKEGWTIAVMLGHLAFWDERRRVMLKIWKEKGVSPIPYILDIVNDTLIPILLAIPPRKVAELAVSTAEALDKELEELLPEMITSIEALQEPTALNRGIHRKMHLDEIDTFLKTKRKAK
ncbi:MAG: DinB family protein [Dehalococcoidales bacterium]